MKKVLLYFLFATVPIISFAQAPPIQWQKCLGGSGDDNAVRVRPTMGGGYILSGSSSSTDGDITNPKGGPDCWIVRLNDTGGIIWQRSLGGSNLDGVGSDIRQTFDSGFIVVGSTHSNDSDVSGNHGGTDCWVVKLSKTGTLQWQRCFGGTGSDFGFSIVQNTDSTYTMAGIASYNNGDVTGNHGSDDVWVVKLSNSGSIIWQKSYGGTGGDVSRMIERTSDGGYIVAAGSASIDGDLTVNHGLTDAWIIKISSTGILQWQRSYGGSGSDEAKYIRQTLDGGYIVSGQTSSNDGDISGNNGSYDAWLFKLSATGSMIWQRTFGGSQSETGNSVEQTSDSGFIFIGTTTSNDSDVSGNHGSTDLWLVRISPTGNIQWQQCYGGSSLDIGQPFIATTTDSGYIFCGGTRSTDGDVSGNHGGTDMWVVKLGFDTVSVNSTPLNPIAHSDRNIFVFPNPAGDILNISGTAHPVVRLYNVYGQLLKEVSDTKSISVSEYSTGIYLIVVYDEHGHLQYKGNFLKK